MKRALCALAMLLCIAFHPSAEANQARPAIDPAMLLSPQQVANFEQQAKIIVYDINLMERNTGMPAGWGYAHWGVENTGTTYGDGASACSAVEQIRIQYRWNPSAGQRNYDALIQIARASKRDINTIKSSCGTATMQRNTGYFGGALGPLQILPSSWVSQPWSVKWDIFDLAYALIWAGTYDRHNHDNVKDPAFNGNENARWQYAVRKYFGSLSNQQSATYYLRALNLKREWDGSRDHVALVRNTLIRHYISTHPAQFRMLQGRRR